MKNSYSFTYPLIGTYDSNGLLKSTEIGWIKVYGQYKLIDGQLTVKSIEYKLWGTTSLTSFVEWLKAGGHYEDIEKAAWHYCGEKHIGHSQNNTAA